LEENRGAKIMNITVILCTFNRCELLATALESVARSQLPETIDWEVLVMDNNSSDRTPDVVESFCKQYPERFRYLFEPKPGKSHALNTGIREARGEVLVFMDDDVTVEPMWLGNLTQILHGSQWAGVGGRVLPLWTAAPPPWLPEGRGALAPLAGFDLGVTAGLLSEAPCGTNMAFRKSVFDKFGGFRTDLGPRPGSEIRSEDAEFGSRLLEAGERLWYEPSAVVYHPITENRLRKQYFLTWWLDKARGDIRAFGTPIDAAWCVAGIPLYLFRRVIVWTSRWIVTLRPSQRFSCKLKVWAYVGEIKERYCLWREASIRNANSSLPSARKSNHSE
jgi:glucosyl-dolichyl phosphate glucuronosyltransferase